MLNYKSISLIIFIISFIVFTKVDGYINELPLFGKVIYVDAGHGGVDPGAVYNNIYEETITLEISKILRDELANRGAIVYMTREDDYDLSSPRAYLRKRNDLSKRAKLINESLCDIYLSVHLNASDHTSWKGAQVFYDDINSTNIVLAKYIQDSFKKNLGSRRSIKEIKDLYMYKNIDRPGLLLEVGFISNDNERYLLRKKYYQNRIVLSIVNGVLDYFENN